LSRGGGAAHGVDVPELNVFREIFYSHLALHFGAGLAEPDYAELGFGALVLEIDDIAWLELGLDAMQRGSAAADGAQAGGLGERMGVRVHTPDFYGKLDENALLAAAVHGCGYTSLVAVQMVEARAVDAQVTGVTALTCRKYGGCADCRLAYALSWMSTRSFTSPEERLRSG